MIDRDSPMTFVEQIARELARRIDEGIYTGRLPTEPELMFESGCARSTVGKAVGRLVAAGIVVRSKRGTFVKKQEP